MRAAGREKVLEALAKSLKNEFCTKGLRPTLVDNDQKRCYILALLASKKNNSSSNSHS